MTKNVYIQPSVQVTEMMMVQALCTSGDPGSSGMPIPDGATTDGQL